MKRLLIVVLLLLVTPAWSTESVDPVLDNRQVLCVVEFSANSNDIDDDSRAAVNEVLNTLLAIDLDSQMIRIEGFSRPDEADCQLLAIDRARAVDEYLRFAKDNHDERFITGIVAQPVSSSEAAPYRAEIVVYDNIFAGAGDPVEITSKELQ